MRISGLYLESKWPYLVFIWKNVEAFKKTKPRYHSCNKDLLDSRHKQRCFKFGNLQTLVNGLSSGFIGLMLIPAPESSIFNLTDDGERGWYFFPSLSPHFSDGWDLHLSESSSTFLCSVSVRIWKKNLRGRLTLYPRWRRKRIRLKWAGSFSARWATCCPCCIHLDDRNRMVRWRVKLRSKEQLYDRPKAISTEPCPTSTALNNSSKMSVAYELAA